MSGPLVLDGLVLAALARRGPSTGRAVSRAVGVRDAVYPALRRLERDQLVVRRPIAASTRRRCLYRVTGDGEEALAAWRLFAGAPSAAARL